LAEYDKRANGANEDDKVSSADSIFRNLKVWVDRNHNGVAEFQELISLEDAGVSAISLDYRAASRVDRFGNRFRYRARVDEWHPGAAGVWAWDVLLKYDSTSK
jgi:hypothetical protein